MPNEELKPCPNPWCSNSMASVRHCPGAKQYYVVICAQCGLNAPAKPTKAEAIATWNSRNSPVIPEGSAEQDREWRCCSAENFQVGPVCTSRESIEDTFRDVSRRWDCRIQSRTVGPWTDAD